MARYIITERLTRVHTSDADPLAQAMSRHSGLYDLRDTSPDAPYYIVNTAYELTMLRAQQALMNSVGYLQEVI